MTMMTRRSLLLGTVATAALLPLAALPAPLPAIPSSTVARTDDALIQDAIDTVERIWDWPAIQGACFGFWMWNIQTAEELRNEVRRLALEDHDAVMWERIIAWRALGEMFTQ